MPKKIIRRNCFARANRNTRTHVVSVCDVRDLTFKYSVAAGTLPLSEPCTCARCWRLVPLARVFGVRGRSESRVGVDCVQSQKATTASDFSSASDATSRRPAVLGALNVVTPILYYHLVFRSVCVRVWECGWIAGDIVASKPRPIVNNIFLFYNNFMLWLSTLFIRLQLFS